MATTPPGFDPNAPFDPTNQNDPRYDPRRDPRYDPRWQRAQQKFYRDQQRAQQQQQRDSGRAQQAAWRTQVRANRDAWRTYLRATRRTSVVGPLLLIAIGLVFFLIHSGHMSGFAFFTWYSRWWPLLLIGVGLLHLGEWAIDRSRQPQGAPSVRYAGGGWVAVIVLFALFGWGLRHAQLRNDSRGFGFVGPWSWNSDNVDHIFGEKHQEDTPPMLHALSPGATLTINSPHGDVTVAGTSDDGQLHLMAHKESFSNSDDTANQRLRDVTPQITGSNDNLTVQVGAVQGGNADLNLLVPATTHVLINSNRGDVHVMNLKAPLAVTANNGDVEIAAITGNVVLHVNHRKRDLNVRSVAGDVQVDGNGDEVNLSDITGTARVTGDFIGGGHFQHIGGSAQFRGSRTEFSVANLPGEVVMDGHDQFQASEVVGPVMIRTRSRNISLDRVTGDVQVVNNHGDVDIHAAPPTGTLTIDNQNGNVNVTMPEKARFSLSAESSDGDARTNFANTSSSGKGMVSGQVNGGGAAVHLTTTHGDISVTRNAAPPLPPAPPAPKLTGYGAVGAPVAPLPPDTSNPDKLQREALSQADEALKEASAATASIKSKVAMDHARQAIRDAEERQRQAEKAIAEKAIKDASK